MNPLRVYISKLSVASKYNRAKLLRYKNPVVLNVIDIWNFKLVTLKYHWNQPNARLSANPYFYIQTVSIVIAPPAS